MQYDPEIRPNSKTNGSDKTNKFFIITKNASLYQTRWQISCQLSWCKLTSMFLLNSIRQTCIQCPLLISCITKQKEKKANEQ